MPPVQRVLLAVAACGLGTVVTTAAAEAQQYSGQASAGALHSGYGGARYSTSQPQSGSTRDANGNRLIVDGIIQSGASSYSRASGAAAAWSGAGSSGGDGATIGGATAIGNSLNVVVQGRNNTVIVNSTQVNNGDVTAGTALNGTLDLP